MADELCGPLPIGQVRMKSYLHSEKSSCPGQPDSKFFRVLYGFEQGFKQDDGEKKLKMLVI